MGSLAHFFQIVIYKGLAQNENEGPLVQNVVGMFRQGGQGMRPFQGQAGVGSAVGLTRAFKRLGLSGVMSRLFQRSGSPGNSHCCPGRSLTAHLPSSQCLLDESSARFGTHHSTREELK